MLLGLIEVNKLGLSERDVDMIYSLKEKAQMIVSTSLGNTYEIEIQEIRIQGTMMCPFLLGNRFKLTSQCMGMLVFVDDINTTGEESDVKKGIRNCHRMEVEKKFTYDMEKTKYTVMETGNQRTSNIKESVGLGEV